jgi:hypothetical protein
MYALLLIALMGGVDATEALGAEVHRFNVSTESAATAIHEFGIQSRVQILTAGEGLRGRHLNTVSGEHSVDEGLRILLAGSGLTHRYVGNRAVALVADQDTREASGPSARASSGPELGLPGGELERTGLIELDQIVVVGTHIRGMAPVGAEVITIERQELDRLGVATAHEAIRTLPQSFAGGVSEDTLATSSTRESGGNIVESTAINLRGLGAASTLVLLNGHRLAPGGQDGIFTDVSNLPLTAIERVEVFPDGASALYGSDAVGGVVNIHLRRDYEGAETRARIGSVTAGGAREYQVGQTFGKSWGSGHGLLSLEYYRRDRLPSSERRQMDSDLRELPQPL